MESGGRILPCRCPSPGGWSGCRSSQRDRVRGSELARQRRKSGHRLRQTTGSEPGGSYHARCAENKFTTLHGIFSGMIILDAIGARRFVWKAGRGCQVPPVRQLVAAFEL